MRISAIKMFMALAEQYRQQLPKCSRETYDIWVTPPNADSDCENVIDIADRAVRFFRTQLHYSEKVWLYTLSMDLNSYKKCNKGVWF